MTTGPETGAPRWSEALSVGVPEIDADHKLLFDLVDQARAAIDGAEVESVLPCVLAALIDYTDYHFAREERMQQAIGFSEARAHRDQHEMLRQRVRAFAAALDVGEFDPIALISFLEAWLVEHIVRQDMRFKPLANGNPAARRAAASVGIEFFMEAAS